MDAYGSNHAGDERLAAALGVSLAQETCPTCGAVLTTYQNLEETFLARMVASDVTQFEYKACAFAIDVIKAESAKIGATQ